MEQYIKLRKSLTYNNYKTIFKYLDIVHHMYLLFPKNFKNIDKFYNSWNYKFLNFIEPLDDYLLSIIEDRYNNLILLSKNLICNKENLDLLNFLLLQKLRIYTEKIFLNYENFINL